METNYHFRRGTQPVIAEDANPPRIGIYSASFDPVHTGHIVFALKAQKVANLERICFVPERQPRRNPEPEHYTHRRIMLKHALRPYKQFEIFDLPDARFTSRGLARVKQTFPRADFSLLATASDLLWHEGELPALYHRYHLIVAVTSHAQMAEVMMRLAGEKQLFGNITFIDIGMDHVSSSAVRKSIRSGKQGRGVLPSVWQYARKQWLYLPPVRRIENR